MDLQVVRPENARRSLSLPPHSSSIWLMVATSEPRAGARIQGRGSEDVLSHLARRRLIPTRLPIVSTSVTISDDELKNLARGDIRLILTRHPDLKRAITSASGRGSVDGIDEMTQLIDPAFAASLR
jgi:hypothetical protein